MAADESTYILDSSKKVTSSKDAGDTGSTGSTADIKQLILSEPQPEGSGITSNLRQTGFNYINSIIGSGVIGIPYALHRAGFGFGILLLLLIAVMTDYSLILLVKGGNIVGVSTYQDFVEAAFGRAGFYLLTVIQFIYPFIAMISYNVIIGDTITKVFRRIFMIPATSIWGNRNFIVFLCTILVTFPLSLPRNISRLNKVSLMSLLFVIFIMMFVLARVGTLSGSVPTTSDAYSFLNSGITEAIGIISFAYMCHHNSFLLYEALENPTQHRWNRITHISIAVSCIVVLVFGIGGYITFTGFSQGDLLENYCMEDDWANVARLLFTVTIMLTYPIECFVTREVLTNALWPGDQPYSMLHHVILTSLITIATYILSTLTDCLGIVLELNGVLAAVPLAYILPAVTYLKVDPSRLCSLHKIPAFLLAGFGIVVAISGTVMAVLNVLHGTTCSHGMEMPYCYSSSDEFINSTMPSVGYNVTNTSDTSIPYFH